MNLLRTIVFAVCFVVWTSLVAIPCTPILLGPRRWSLIMFHVWGHGLFVILGWVGVKVEIRGREHIPTGASLVAPKHQCMLDVYAQFTCLPDSAFVMKKELRWVPWFGWYATKAGCIDIDRSAHATALRKMVRDAKLVFARGQQVVIFPEGTRGEPGVRGVYKPGIAALYRELDVPVHPVATNSGEHWPPRGFLIRRPGTIVFEYLEPIPPGLKRAEFMRILEERIETKSTELLGL